MEISSASQEGMNIKFDWISFKGELIDGKHKSILMIHKWQNV